MCVGLRSAFLYCNVKGSKDALKVVEILSEPCQVGVLVLVRGVKIDQ
jgi:hypothetical protein